VQTESVAEKIAPIAAKDTLDDDEINNKNGNGDVIG